MVLAKTILLKTRTLSLPIFSSNKNYQVLSMLWNAKVLVASLVLGCCMTANAATPDDFSQEFINRRLNISPLGSTLFGDTTALSSGVTEFEQTDIDLPGNNGLPVRLTRRHQPGTYVVNSPLGDWEISIPHLSGTFGATTGNGASGWQVLTPGLPNQRCSVDPNNPINAQPPGVTGNGPYPATLEAAFYWYGNNLYIPGQGEHSMMVLAPANSNRPTDGATYRWVTDNQWMFSCLGATANGVPGEAFLAVSPDGTRYWFNWFAKAPAGTISVTGGNPPYNWRSDIGREIQYILPTRVEDRFGNYVTYAYDPANPRQLSSIQSSDGRRINLYYTGIRLTSAVAGTQTWTYGYTVDAGGRTLLDNVVLPDTSRWKFESTGINNNSSRWVNCADLLAPVSSLVTTKITHPSGAVGTFTFVNRRLGRSYVPKICVQYGDAHFNLQSTYVDVLALSTKVITGPGLATPSTWSVAFGPSNGSWDIQCGSSPCPDTRVVTATEPDGSANRYTFGTRYGSNEGKLLSQDVLSPSGQVLKSETNTYVFNPAGQPYPARLGSLPCRDCDRSAETLFPQKSRTITQQGVTFSNTATAFDAFARATAMTKSNTIGSSKTEGREYFDETTLWVIGQFKRALVNGVEVDRIDFDSKAMPWKTYRFGKLQQVRTYETMSGAAAGTLKTVQDGRGNVSTFTDWKRGIPQTATYPATVEAPYGAVTTAVVNDNGWIDSVRDVTAGQRCYTYDAMGRVASITYPFETDVGQSDCSTSSWSQTTQAFVQVGFDEYGIGAGHWRATVTTGNAERVTYFDALLRPLLTREQDLSNPGQTTRFSGDEYDGNGRRVFTAYPLSSIASRSNLTQGVRTTYDGLDRVTKVDQDSELGVLTTLTEYLDGFQTRVTNPRQYSTTVTQYLAWDEPTTDLPLEITHAEVAFTSIARDVFGKATSIMRLNDNGSVALERNYIYNAQQELCKTIEPETGTLVTHFDSAGNLDWSAPAQNSLNRTDCSDQSSVPASSRIVRSYDARNRLESMTFPGGNGSQSWRYTADSLPAQITTNNDAGATTATNSYQYYRRRMLKSETLAQPSMSVLSLGYGYSATGALSSITYPNGQLLNYAPNALGQPTQAGTYASSVLYYPNGAIQSFTYGNGIVHSLEQNARLLPYRSIDGSVLNDTYAYDQNGNTSSITDGTSGSRGNRSMTFDELDRLKTTISPMFSGGTDYSYDALDNLTHVKAPGRDQYYCYEANTWRLTQIRTGSCSGAVAISLGYDAGGNLASKGGQSYTFDIGNRLRSVPGKEKYRYDGYGRRIAALADAGSGLNGDIYSFYGQDGALRYQRDERAGTSVNYITLNGSLVAGVRNVATPRSVTLSVPGTGSGGSYSVSWTSANGASSYELQESAGSGWVTIQSGAATSRAVSGKSAGTYIYRVRSCNSGGCSDWSNEGQVVVPPPPGTPTLTVPATSSTGAYTASWTSVSNATRYELEENAGGGWSLIQNTSATDRAISGKGSGTYSYRVKACSVDGCGALSSAASVVVTLPPATAPAVTAPSSNFSGSYTVSWSTVSGASSYSLQQAINSGGWSAVTSGAGTSYLFGSLAAATYYYRVQACNAGGCGPWSATATTVVTLAPTSAPTLTAPSSSNTGSFVVSWNAISAATSYLLEESANGGSWTQVQNSSAVSASISGKGNGSYSYRVRACNAAGCGPNSVSASTTVALPPGTPTLTARYVVVVMPSYVRTNYTFTWTSSSGATSYELQTNAGLALYTGPATSYSYQGLGGPSSGTTYRIRACASAGCSAWSAYVSATGG